ncbi:MAG: hypothetical protein ACPGVT_07905 [Maricaulaceae bacterium]
MRIKHIILPVIALGLLSAYSVYDHSQKSRFNSDLWITAQGYDVEHARYDMVGPLMTHVLKTGMSMEEVKALIGTPHEERTKSCYYGLGEAPIVHYYNIEPPNAYPMQFVLEYSEKQRLTNFYIPGNIKALFY